jgi:hypothetical protein
MTEKLYKTPKPGDTLTLPDGRVWTVTEVHERRPHGLIGEERVSYDFVAADGAKRSASPMHREFVSRFGRLVREGAVYRRGRQTVTVEVPVVEEMPSALDTGALIAQNGELYVATGGTWMRVRLSVVEVSAR